MMQKKILAFTSAGPINTHLGTLPLPLTFVAGALFGASAAAMTQPFNTLNALFFSGQFKGMSPFQIAAQLVREKGAAALWKGGLPLFLTVIPQYGAKMLLNKTFNEVLPDFGLRVVVAAALAGACDALLLAPTETGIRLGQFELGKTGHLLPGKPSPGFVKILRMIVEKHGLSGLMAGSGGLMFRNAAFTGPYIWLFSSLLRQMTESESETLNMGKITAAAFLSTAVGTVASAAGHRVMVSAQKEFFDHFHEPGFKFGSSWVHFKRILSQEGVQGFYKGFVPYALNFGRFGVSLSLFSAAARWYDRQAASADIPLSSEPGVPLLSPASDKRSLTPLPTATFYPLNWGAFAGFSTLSANSARKSAQNAAVLPAVNAHSDSHDLSGHMEILQSFWNA